MFHRRGKGGRVVVGGHTQGYELRLKGVSVRRRCSAYNSNVKKRSKQERGKNVSKRKGRRRIDYK